MQSIELKSSLQDLLVKSTGQTLQALQKIFATNQREQHLLIKLRKDHQELLDSEMMGMRGENFETNKHRLTFNILQLIDTITEEDAIAYNLSQSKFQKILVICKVPERESFMRSFFPAERWKATEFNASGQPLETEYVNQFDLIVFDNEPHNSDGEQHALLKYYLGETTLPIFYYGGYLKLLDDYKMRVHSANTVFSFHGRLEEMINYLNQVR